jgi:hypothetical protein
VNGDLPDAGLAELLARADRAASPAAVRTDLAGRVRRRASRAGVRRAAAAAVAIGVGLSWAIWAKHGTTQRSEKSIAAATLNPDVLIAEVARLRDEAEVHRLTAEAILRLRRERLERERAAAALKRPDPLDALTWERERAALILVDRGNRMSRAPEGKPEAIAAYRRATELFPGTHWADVAVVRLQGTGRF